MKTIIDAAGRLVIPEEIRRQAGLRPDTELEVRWRDGRIELEPAAMLVRLERRGHLLVAVAEERVAEMTVDVVEETRQARAYKRSGTK